MSTPYTELLNYTPPKDASDVAPYAYGSVGYFLVFCVSNPLNADGRIGLGKDAQGREMSHTLSPFAYSFKHDIEPAIWPVVEVLVGLKYMTYSSCQGHSAKDRPYVKIAFKNEQKRSEFGTCIKHLLGGWADVLPVTDHSLTEYRNPSLYPPVWSPKLLNTMFRKRLDSYCFATLELFSQSGIPRLVNRFERVKKYGLKIAARVLSKLPAYTD